MKNVFAAAAIAGLFSVAALPAYASEGGAENTATGAAIVHACADLLKLSPAETAYQACTASLSDSVARVAYFKAEAQAHQSAASACAAQGINQGDDGYAMCIYNHTNATVTVSDVSMGSN